jgi:hypothetical protein
VAGRQRASSETPPQCGIISWALVELARPISSPGCSLPRPDAGGRMRSGVSGASDGCLVTSPRRRPPREDQPVGASVFRCSGRLVCHIAPSEGSRRRRALARTRSRGTYSSSFLAARIVTELQPNARASGTDGGWASISRTALLPRLREAARGSPFGSLPRGRGGKSVGTVKSTPRNASGPGSNERRGL